MANWWESDPLAQSPDGGVSTIESGGGGDWWNNDPLANAAPAESFEDSGTYGPLSVPIYAASAAMNWGAGPKPWDLEENASELEKLRAKRLRELYEGPEPLDLDDDMPLVDRQVAERTHAARHEQLTKDRARMESLGMSPEEYLQQERYDQEQDPTQRMINAPILRGAMTGVSNAASHIGETALRLLPGAGAPSELADKIGRSRADESQYQQFLNKKQGKAAGYVDQTTSMIGEYLPVAALTGGAGVAGQSAASGANDAYLKSDSDLYALTSAIIQGGLTYAGGKLGGGTIQEMLGGRVKAKAATQLVRSYGAEGGEELGQLFGQAMLDRGFGVDDRMPTGEDVLDTLAVVLLGQSAGSVMSAKVGNDPAPSMMPDTGPMAAKAKAFVESKWPSRKKAVDAGVAEIAPTARKRNELSAKARDRLTGQQLKEQFTAVATSPEEADAVFKLVEARAQSAGESLNDYVGSRIKGVEKGRKADATTVKQGAARNPRGEIQFIKDGRAIIRAFEGQNISTLAHEVGHLFRRDLDGGTLATAEKWAGAKDGKWSRPAEEKFARGFERYLRTGRAPTTGLKPVFEKFKGWLKNVYKAVRGTPLDVNFNKEMRGVYDSLFLPQETQMREGVATDAQNLSPSENSGIAEELPSKSLETPESAADQTLSQDLADRFRGLANHATDLTAREANFRADQELGYPETRPRTVAETAAAQRLQSDPVGTLRDFLGRIDEADRTGGAITLDEADAVTLARLKEQAGIEGYGNGDPEARALHRRLNRAFREARTETARQLGIRDPLGTQRASETPQDRSKRTISEAMSEPTPEEREARRQAKTPEDHEELDRQEEERFQKLRDRLRKDGIDIDDLDSVVADRAKVTKAINRIKDSGKFGDKAFEYWRNAIMSAVSTVVTNASQIGFAGYHLTVERAAETAVNLFVRDKKGAQLGEWGHMLGAVLPGMARGARNAMASWRSETDILSEELGRSPAYRIDGPRGAIQGKHGRLIRAMGYRPALFVDQFVSSVVGQIEASAHAYRIAKAESEGGSKAKKNKVWSDEPKTDFTERIRQLVEDTESDAWTSAYAKSEELGFRGTRGMVADAFGYGIDTVRRVPGGKYVVPFRDTPAGIFEEAVKRTPLIGAWLDYAESRRQGKSMGDSGMTPTLARQTIAMAGVMMLMATNDPEDPWITGAADLSDAKKRDSARRAGPQPQSIKIGGEWYDYSRIEPFATVLAWTVDATEGVKRGEPLKYIKNSTYQQLKNKTWLDGLGDALEAVDSIGDKDAKAGMQWLSKFAASWVPNMYRRTVASARGYTAERKAWGTEKDLIGRVLKRTAQAMELPFVDDLPKFDVWGKPVYYNTPGESATSDFLWSLASPVTVKDLDSVSKIDLALSRWNRLHHDEAIAWIVPDTYVREKGVTHHFTDEQYAEYAERAGNLAATMAARVRVNPENPTKEQLEAVGRAISKARASTRRALLPKWRIEWRK